MYIYLFIYLSCRIDPINFHDYIFPGWGMDDEPDGAVKNKSGERNEGGERPFSRGTREEGGEAKRRMNGLSEIRRDDR